MKAIFISLLILFTSLIVNFETYTCSPLPEDDIIYTFLTDPEDPPGPGELCEDGVSEVIFGNNILVGCWGNDDICKIKCK